MVTLQDFESLVCAGAIKMHELQVGGREAFSR
jgi:hypothetical protein